MEGLITIGIVILFVFLFVRLIDRLCCTQSEKFHITKWILKNKKNIVWNINEECLIGCLDNADCSIKVSLYLKFDIFKNKIILSKINYYATGKFINENISFVESSSFITSRKIKKLGRWAKNQYDIISKGKELNLL
jgi:hypothetical protein